MKVNWTSKDIMEEREEMQQGRRYSKTLQERREMRRAGVWKNRRRLEAEEENGMEKIGINRKRIKQIR
jgi:hypothetical protein